MRSLTIATVVLVAAGCAGCMSPSNVGPRKMSYAQAQERLALIGTNTDPVAAFLLHDAVLTAGVSGRDEQVDALRRRRDELYPLALDRLTNEYARTEVWNVSEVTVTNLGPSFREGPTEITARTGTLIRVHAAIENISTTECSPFDYSRFSKIKQAYLKMVSELSRENPSGQWLDDSDMYVLMDHTIRRCVYVCNSSEFPVKTVPMVFNVSDRENSTRLFQPRMIPRDAQAWVDMIFIVPAEPVGGCLLIRGGKAVAFPDSKPGSARPPVREKGPAPPGMVWIEGGDVQLGQAGIAEPVRTRFVDGFWMGATEVTKAQWDEVYHWAIRHGYAFDNTGSGKTNDHPVHTVNWYDCVKWCNARSEMEGKIPAYYTSPEHVLTNVYRKGKIGAQSRWVRWDTGYRLPTEAEWEKAARGGVPGRLFPWGGDTIQHARANYLAQTNQYAYDTSATDFYHPQYRQLSEFGWNIGPSTSPVGSFAATGNGLYDMTGNVSEWCWDWFSERDLDAPHAVRGGSWADTADSCRLASRRSQNPSGRGFYATGFRVVLPPGP